MSEYKPPRRPISSTGRPRIYGVPATEVLQIRVTTPVRVELQRIADRTGVRICDVVRHLIDDRVIEK